jgi:hypothetical protein
VRINESEEGDERTTDYVMRTLGEDLDKCFKRLEKDFDNPDENGLYDYDESDAREFVRAAFACIEGTSFSVRMWAAEHLLNAGSERARAFSVRSEHGLSWSSDPQFPRVVERVGTAAGNFGKVWQGGGLGRCCRDGVHRAVR